MEIKQASVKEALEVIRLIPEFARGESVESIQARLKDRNSLILMATQGEIPLGVKIGYQLDSSTFYSWLGGVAPQGRNHGVAQALLEAQELWVQEQGYSAVRVKSRNCFPAMLRLLLRNGYLIESIEQKENIEDNRLNFIKQISI
ncbi:GNAT family N-acetyltransferase [Vibrio sp. Of7-15]|uniref:GNAT family N-acetyltransferase n=1 Tax=Vibrio sp. Of7-15 TaxID=2724879 RepID=UPI001EF315D8|nr:GNAT family N-acetyltransferase [Vibrio sp. Of7-15]